MARYCSDCTYLNPNDKKCDGQYKCSKIKKHVLANMPACDKYGEAYARKNRERERLYDLAKELEKKPSGAEPATLFAISVVLIIILIILNIFL